MSSTRERALPVSGTCAESICSTALALRKIRSAGHCVECPAWGIDLFLGHVGDLKLGAVVGGLDVDGDHVLVVVRNQRAMVLVRGARHCIGELLFVEAA